MRKRLPLILLAVAPLVWDVAPAHAQAQGEQSKESQAEQPPPSAPTVTRSTGGIIVVTGAGSGSPPVKVEAAEKKEEAVAEAPAEKEADPATAAPVVPKSTTVSSYTYGPDGQKRAEAIQSAGSADADSSQTTRTLTNIHGREVPYLTESSNVLKSTPGNEVVEKRLHRYDTNGNPTSQQLVREEQRRLPDGSIEKTITTYESDINGLMNAVQRVVETQKITGNVTRTTVTAERPDFNKRLKTYERTQSEREQHTDDSGKVKTVRQADNGLGRLIEVERSESVMSRSGDAATTETKVWQRSVVNQDKFELTARTVGKLVEKPNGTATETVEVYAASVDGSANNLNNTGEFDLQERIQRETTP
ncbi:MAG TPA: hypothetical protein VML01_08575, partial [Bryobacterales bacterium]|nr:hypothetical protein [Bryobacterales bacterium]